MQPRKQPTRISEGSVASYRVRIAEASEDIRAAQALRYQVFNVELNEGLAASHATGLDTDAFDDLCDHLVVEHVPSKAIVGTYRLQTGSSAGQHLGYYSAQEFDLRCYEPYRAEMVELGRACVDRAHRNLNVLGMLWKGIADYAQERGCRYLFGCSSITSQDPAVGASAYTEMCRKHLVRAELRTRPWPKYECSLDRITDEKFEIPKLLRTYLVVGARICGPPAIDREFGTIDFLTWINLDELSLSAWKHFMGTR